MFSLAFVRLGHSTIGSGTAAIDNRALHRALPDLPFLEIVDRGKRGALKLTPPDPLPETVNLRALKRDMHRRWGTVALIDMLKEAILRTGCLGSRR